ncbi:hypothetical protein [Mucilaginibacter sp.]|uniref:hypothetical protein n=1 Tax=Mucilaginibacter sp. TaxID=1882438 RepID=UPI00262B0904|nr:hypothetical protein [Mucilaginibacter sp.]MDB5128350.1 hypothetical protein [Mucilaginibacter sp.]
MNHIDFFKLQAKNLFRDYKTQKTALDENGDSYSKYVPKFFDIDAIFEDYEIDNEDFSLMNAQHLLAKMLRFNKWSDLINATMPELELAKLKFVNQNKIPLIEWDIQVARVEREHHMVFDPEDELDYFKHCLSHYDESVIFYPTYLLEKNLEEMADNESDEPPIVYDPETIVKITSLPLSGDDRAEFIAVANNVFDYVINRMELLHPEPTRKLWDAEGFLDNLLNEEILPIDREQLWTMFEHFLIGHVADLAAQADEKITRMN